MTIDHLRRVLRRDLETLRREIRAYGDEADLWTLPQGLPNSAGTLALHLVGNLQHYVGAQLGATGYVRDRDAEFSDRGIARAEIEARLDATIDAVGRTLEALGPDDLDRDFPEPIGGVPLTTGIFLLHLATHFAYHLGQIDYHRRVVSGDTSGVDAQSVRALAEAV